MSYGINTYYIAGFHTNINLETLVARLVLTHCDTANFLKFRNSGFGGIVVNSKIRKLARFSVLSGPASCVPQKVCLFGDTQTRK